MRRIIFLWNHRITRSTFQDRFSLVACPLSSLSSSSFLRISLPFEAILSTRISSMAACFTYRLAQECRVASEFHANGNDRTLGNRPRPFGQRNLRWLSLENPVALHAIHFLVLLLLASMKSRPPRCYFTSRLLTFRVFLQSNCDYYRCYRGNVCCTVHR